MGVCTLPILLAAFVLAPPSVEAGDALDTLIRQYRSLAEEAGPLRNKKQKLNKLINKQINPVLADIAATGGTRVIDFFARELNGSIPALATACARAAGKIDDLASTQMLIGSLRPRASAPDAWKPDAAASYNAAVLESLTKLEDEAAREWLASGAFRRASEVQLRVLAELAGRLGLEESHGQLAKLLGHGDESVVHAALGGICDVGIGKALRKVLRLRISTLPLPLQVKVIDGLAAHENARARKRVIELAGGKDIETAAIALGSLRLLPDDRGAFDVLLEGLRHASLHAARAALRSLSEFRVKEMVPALIEALGREESYGWRVQALELLVTLTGHNMGLVIEDWNKWWETEAERFEFAAGDTGRTRVDVHDLRYFGIEIASKRIAFLVDASNSMLQTGKMDGKEQSGTKLAIMQEELTRILENLPADTRINIVGFHKSFFSWREKIEPLRGSNRGDAVDFVKTLRCAFGTNIYDTLEFALRDADVDTIFFLSDGLPYGGTYTKPRDILREIGAINRTRRVTINTISFGKETQFLKKLAAENFGVHRFADGEPEDDGESDAGGQRAK